MRTTPAIDGTAARQVIVQVEASGISFAEQSMGRNRYPGQLKFPFGPGVDSSLTGSRVAALTKTGGWSSFALLPAESLLPVPDGIDPVEAET